MLQAESMMTALTTPPQTPHALPPPTGAPKKRRGGKLMRIRRTKVRVQALVSDEEEETEKEGQSSLDSIKGYTAFLPSPATTTICTTSSATAPPHNIHSLAVSHTRQQGHHPKLRCSPIHRSAKSEWVLGSAGLAVTPTLYHR